MASSARLFVIGGGGREHALVWHLSRAFPKASLYCAPGNPGIARLATCLPIAATDIDALVDAAASLEIDHTLVGPEAPLVAGIVDAFEARGVSVIGPRAAAARVEGSKVFAKDLMRRHRIPTADAVSFEDPAAALAYVRGHGSRRGLVIKADGLAAGKGVTVCDDADAAAAAVQTMMIDGAFGAAGRRVVIEDRMEGPEVSAFALVDAEAVAMLPAAQDHKRIFDGDRGPNTGGMGAAAPYPLNRDLRQCIRDIFERVAHALCAEGSLYRGVLFAGLMLTSTGLQVLEFNCRLGDPEAQALLPLLDADMSLLDAFAALREGELGDDRMAQPGAATVAVVLASRGYPQAPQTAEPLEGLDAAEADALIFPSGPAERDGRLVSSGGRVLTVVGRSAGIGEARARAYRAAGAIQFAGIQFRADIGANFVETRREAAVVAPTGSED
jgi:phosphoribosylamine--glycine ligase